MKTQKIKNQKSKSTKIDKRFLVLFQEEINVDKDPEWILGVKQDKFFYWDNDNNEPMVFNAIVPKQYFDKLEMWAQLCSYETNTISSSPTYNVKPQYLDSFISMLAKVKKAAE
jgi:hypothetical protein